MNKNRFIQLLESKLGNVKPLLNETYVNYSAKPTFQSGPVDNYYGKATISIPNQTLILNQAIDCEKNAKTTGTEIRLMKGTTFRRKGVYLVTTNATVDKVDDFFGSPQGTLTGKTVKIHCTPTEGTYNVYIDGETTYWYGENWHIGVRNAVKDLCASKPPPTAPTVAQATTAQCTEYNNRLQTPVIANAGDIQTFLKNIGYNITVDYAFGNGTATALGTFMYGPADKSGINSVQTLWQKMKDSGLDVGTTPGFGLKMATAAAKWINEAIPKLVKTKCVKPK